MGKRKKRGSFFFAVETLLSMKNVSIPPKLELYKYPLHASEGMPTYIRRKGRISVRDDFGSGLIRKSIRTCPRIRGNVLLSRIVHKKNSPTI